jgi:hypothetical protein
MLLSKGHIQRIIKEAQVVRWFTNRGESRVVLQTNNECEIDVV